MPYDLSGTPQQAIAGDFFVNKAAANVVVLHPILGELEIWTTHVSSLSSS
jgi:sphingomyelin phosphodiesterase 2